MWYCMVADDWTTKVFNLVYFEDADRNIIDIVQTASVGYLMDENGKTFEVIRLKK